MRNSTRHLVFLLTLVLSAGMLLPACGSGGTSTAPPAAESPAGEGEPASEISPSGESAEPEADSILVVMQKHTAVDVLVEKLGEFTEKTGITVNTDILPQEEVTSKVQLQLSTGASDVDVVMYDNMFTTQFAGAGWIENLSPYISRDQVDIQDFMDGFVAALSYEDNIYGLPIYGESTMLMYNTELFAQAGLTGPPKNKAEFMEYVAALDAAGIPAYASRGFRSIGGINYIWSGFVLGHGGKWFDSQGKVAFNSPETVTATEVYADLLANHSVPGGTTMNWDQVQLALQQGSVAMAIDATNFAARIENPENSTIAGKVGYAVVPEGLCVPSVSCWGLAIPTASSKKEAAWMFIDWALGKEMQLATTVDGERNDVTRKSVMNDPAFIEKYNFEDGNWIQVTIDSMASAPAEYRPRLAEWNEMGDALASAVSAVVSGQSTAADAIAEAERICKNMTYVIAE